MQASSSNVHLVPLGGLGEVGMNCMVIGQDEQYVIVDCGMGFPAGDLGVDVLHPDFTWLLANRSKVVAVVLTHGHEDHIGALPYLLKELPLPIYGSPHALALVSRRLAEHPGLAPLELHTLRPRSPLKIGPFEIEPIRMSHSISSAFALGIRTAQGLCVHSGDFKFDPDPADGERSDEERLLEWGEAGVRLLLSDSTNSAVAGTSGSEGKVALELEKQFQGAASARIFVALFSSNVQRLLSLGRIAQRQGRRICLLGRSLTRHVDVARRLGLLEWPDGLLMPPEAVPSTPAHQCMVLASGTQAEPGSAMMRLAHGTNRWIQLNAEDLVVFSSRTIPGREREVSAMISVLLRRGVRVLAGARAGVHVSGHAYQEEQRHLLQLLEPACFVPVHGTLMHMQSHATLAQEEGVPDRLVVENGQSIELTADGLRKGERVASGKVPIGFDGRPVEAKLLAERRELARAGQVSVTCILSSDGTLLAPVGVRFQGVSPAGEERQLAAHLESQWAEWQRQGKVPTRREVERAVRGWFNSSPLRPSVGVQLLELERSVSVHSAEL